MTSDAGATLQERVYRQVRKGILAGHLAPGLKLPSSRDLARDLRISRNTVALAFEWLASEGYVETRVGAGTFVAGLLPEAALEAPREAGLTEGVLAGPDMVRRVPPVISRSVMPAAVGRAGTRPSIDFWYGRVDRREFPTQTWRRLINENLSRAGPNLVDYADPAGHPELRNAIGDFLEATRGMDAPASRILITAGAQDGLNIIADMLVEQGTEVVVEDPCYEAAALVFEGHGASLRPVRVDRHGIVIDELERVTGSLLYLTPSHQFPTGATLPLHRRRDLLRWAAQVGSYVVEDDYDSDFRYDGPPLAALSGLDQDGRVIYLGSFSKSIGAGLRLGYLVLPEELVQPALAAKSLGSYGQPWLDQIVVADFLRSGAHRQHLRRLRQLYRTRRDVLVRQMHAVFGEVALSGGDAGMHLIWTPAHALPEPEAIASAALARDVGIYTLQAIGAREFCPPDARRRALMLGYAALTPKEIVTGVGRIGAALDLT